MMIIDINDCFRLVSRSTDYGVKWVCQEWGYNDSAPEKDIWRTITQPMNKQQALGYLKSNEAPELAVQKLEQCQ